MQNLNLSRANTELAPVFAALGDPTRLSLLVTLSVEDTLSISELADNFKLSRQAVTKHLRILEDKQLVTSEKVGRETRYAFQTEQIDELGMFLNRVSAQWGKALSRFKVKLEKEV